MHLHYISKFLHEIIWEEDCVWATGPWIYDWLFEGFSNDSESLFLVLWLERAWSVFLAPHDMGMIKHSPGPVGHCVNFVPTFTAVIKTQSINTAIVDKPGPYCSYGPCVSTLSNVLRESPAMVTMQRNWSAFWNTIPRVKYWYLILSSSFLLFIVRLNKPLKESQKKSQMKS